MFAGAWFVLSAAIVTLFAMVSGAVEDSRPPTLPRSVFGMAMAVFSVWLSQRPSEPRIIREIESRPTLCWLAAGACLAAATAIVHPGGLLKIIYDLLLYARFAQRSPVEAQG